MKAETIITLLVLIATIYIFFNHAWTFYLFILIIGLIIFYIFFVKKYNELERGIIFRMGKFNRVVGPGWSIVLPFFEKEFAKIDARTHMMEINIDEAFTNDDLRLSIKGLFYYTISDPEKAILKIENYEKGIKNLIISEVRDTIGNLNMREVFAKLDVLDSLVLDKIRNNSWKFGIDVSMIQIKSVAPPIEIAKAMQGKEIAMQELQAQRFKSEAKKVIINAIGSASKNLDDKAMMYIYLEALKSMGSGAGSKILFPAKFMNILGGMGNNILKNNNGLNLASTIEKVKNSILNNK